ncbi:MULTISPECIES: aspartate kinase [Streptomyces]|uniref:Aspartokinase n=1 Tax=Streptomyces pyridomyceticus TaxID=68260 RepID=F6K7H8_9ACTN|nr:MULTISPECIES: aspartate kinase [Streptomyces]AEF33090.1 aspartate kinase [Streptomyces pyridomyceticus]
MALIVQKYGGTSVATPEKVIEAARQVRAAREEGHQVVVVVSAMGGATDGLLRLASAVTDLPVPRELDGLLSTGEAASAALLSLALNHQGVASRSFSGAQAGIRTDHRHGKATIVQVDPRRLREDLGRGMVPVVAGFQGESVLTGACTTLGRGGSDTTGVALAAALGADHCEIVTDVAGVYTADPRTVVGARRHTGLSYEEMAELAVSGAKVLAADSVDYARTHGVELKVRANSTATGPKTWVGHGRSAGGPTPGDSRTADGQGCPIAGVAGRSGLVRCVLRRISPDHVLRLLRELAEREIEVELRRYGNLGTEDAGDIALTLPEESAEELRELLADTDRGIHLDEAHWTSNLARLSVVGLGIGRRPYAPLHLLEALRSVDAARADVHVTSNRVSVLTGRSDLAEATQIVHDTFVSGPEMPAIHPVDPDDADTTWSLTAERGHLDVELPALAAAE